MPELDFDPDAARKHLSATVGHLTQFNRGHLPPEDGRPPTNRTYVAAWSIRLRVLGEVITELGLTDFLSRKYLPEQLEAIQTKTLLLHVCREPGDFAALQGMLERMGADEKAEEWKVDTKLFEVGERIREACGVLERALPTESVPTTQKSPKGAVPDTTRQAGDDPARTLEIGTKVVDKRRVFVIYGQNRNAYDSMVLFLRSLGLIPWDFYELSATCGGSAFIGDIVRRGMEDSQAVVALFTPDEFAVLRPSLKDLRKQGAECQRWQSRPNVIYEAGMAMGIDETRTILATLGSDVSLFSDVSGVHIVQLDNTPEKRSFLRSKLHGVGCAVDMAATEYLVISRAGDFVKCIEFGGEAEPVDTFGGSASPKKKPASGRRKPGRAQSGQRILAIDQDQIGPHTSSGDPAGRRTDFRVRLRITNKTVRNVTLTDVHAIVRSHDGRILHIPFSESREQAVPPRDGTVLITGVTPTMLAREDQVPKLGLVVVRIAQQTEPIRKVFDDEIAAQSELTG